MRWPSSSTARRGVEPSLACSRRPTGSWGRWGRGLDLGRLEDCDPRRAFDAPAAQLANQADPGGSWTRWTRCRPDWLGHVLRRLESAKGVRVLATARFRFEGASGTQVLAVLPLSDTEARAFVAEHARAYGPALGRRRPGRPAPAIPPEPPAVPDDPAGQPPRPADRAAPGRRDARGGLRAGPGPRAAPPLPLRRRADEHCAPAWVLAEMDSGCEPSARSNCRPRPVSLRSRPSRQCGR